MWELPLGRYCQGVAHFRATKKPTVEVGFLYFYEGGGLNQTFVDGIL